MEIFELGDFRLRCGITLPAARLAYRVHGTLNDARDNAILFPNFLGGTPQALESWIGPGRALDPRRYCIILPGHFGSPPTSAPSNTPAPFQGGAFPAVHISDDVIAQQRLLSEHFGIDSLSLVLGWSVGALQTYEWAVRFPRMVRRMASIAGAPHPSDWTRLWLRTVIEEPFTADPAWRGGDYRDAAELSGAARRVGHAAALTLAPNEFYAEGRQLWRGLGFGSVDDFVVRFWEAFWLSNDPGDVVAQARKACAADPSGGGEPSVMLGAIQARTAVIAFTGDPMFTPEQCRHDAERIPDARFHQIDSPYGHLATFGLSAPDVKAVDEALGELLGA